MLNMILLGAEKALQGLVAYISLFINRKPSIKLSEAADAAANQRVRHDVASSTLAGAFSKMRRVKGVAEILRSASCMSDS